MARDYIDEDYCPFCKKYTKQEFHDDGHERDLTYDRQKCLTCDSEMYWHNWYGPDGERLKS